LHKIKDVSCANIQNALIECVFLKKSLDNIPNECYNIDKEKENNLNHQGGDFMKKYRVEFNTTGFYSGQGVFETLDELTEVEAHTAQEAIECSIDYMVETECAAYEDCYDDTCDLAYDDDGNVNVDAVRDRIESWAWYACELIYDEDGNRVYDEYGTPVYGEAEYREEE
jgi:hypothetical protein